MSILSAVSRWHNQGWFEGRGPLVLNPVFGTFDGELLETQQLREQEKIALEKILAGSGNHSGLEFRYETVSVPLATDKEARLRELNEYNAKIKSEEVKDDFTGVMRAILYQEVQDCDRYRITKHLVIKDGSLKLFLGSQVLDPGRRYGLTPHLEDDIHSIKLAEQMMAPPYRGSETAVSYGDPKTCLEKVYGGSQKFQYSEGIFSGESEFNRKLFTVTRIGHNSFEIYAKRLRDNFVRPALDMAAMGEIEAAHQVK